MARNCAVAAALCALVLVAPAPAAARSRALHVALPSPGDVTLMHVNFKRSVARSRKPPRFGGLSASARQMLRRAGVTVVGSSLRLSRKRTVGSVVLLRRKGTRRAGSARQRSVRVLVDRPVGSIVTQRNVLRRRAPRPAGARVAQLGPMVCVTNEELMKGTQIHSDLLFEDDELDRIPEAVLEREAPELAYGLFCDVYRPSLTPLLESIGSKFPVSCTFSSTYIGSATDSEGNVLTEPSLVWGIQCSKTIDELALVVHAGYVKFCEDSADRPCQVATTLMPMDTALFPYRIKAGIDASFVIRAEPPLQRGEVFEVLIDLVDHGEVRDDQVM